MVTTVTEEKHGNGRAGRPRNAAIDEVILDVTVSLLSERGFHGVSTEDIAVRAHTGKDTIYRRWPSKQQLVAAALEHLVIGSIATVPGGAGRGLVDYLVELDRLVASTPVGHVVASAIGESTHDAEIAEWLSGFWAARVEEASRFSVGPMDGGGGTARLGPLGLELLFGALFHRWFVQPQPVSREDVAGLVATVRGLADRPHD